MKIMKIIKERGSVLRSGTSYILRPDDVHIEFNATPDKVQAVADRLRNGQSSAPEVKPATSKPPSDRATVTEHARPSEDSLGALRDGVDGQRHRGNKAWTIKLQKALI
jgi:hypothetical protein